MISILWLSLFAALSQCADLRPLLAGGLESTDTSPNSVLPDAVFAEFVALGLGDEFDGFDPSEPGLSELVRRQRKCSPGYSTFSTR